MHIPKLSILHPSINQKQIFIQTQMLMLLMLELLLELLLPSHFFED